MQSVTRNKISVLPLSEKYIDDVIEIDESYSTSPWSREIFINELRNDFSYNFVLISHGKVAGFTNFWIICDVMELNNFAIRKEFRGKGLGRLFISFITESGKILNVSKIFLEVKKDNYNAISLYKKTGFYVAGLRKNYYSDGNDAILMEKIL